MVYISVTKLYVQKGRNPTKLNDNIACLLFISKNHLLLGNYYNGLYFNKFQFSLGYWWGCGKLLHQEILFGHLCFLYLAALGIRTHDNTHVPY